MNPMKTLALLTLILTASVFANAETESPVHLFILSGQSNMQGMDPETGFMTEATKLFGDETGCLHQGGQGWSAHLPLAGGVGDDRDRGGAG